MPISEISIHPAIGIARVGDSEEFFIGPEKPYETPDPDGGFKDDACRVKKQAARFRLFAHYEDDSRAPKELTADDVAAIEWKVELANRKAVSRNHALDDRAYEITPGPRRLNGPNQRATFDSGEITFQDDSELVTATVPLGEIRTDDEGRLLVLGGDGDARSPTDRRITGCFDNKQWYDDIADGPVKARVELEDGRTFEMDEVADAWIVVGPPKFAPELENAVTLYDRLYDLMASQDRFAEIDPPPTYTPEEREAYTEAELASGGLQPSFTRHIHPILRRAKQTRWVTDSDRWDHAWSGTTDFENEPGVRQWIFRHLKDPSKDEPDEHKMPRLADGPDHVEAEGHLPMTHYRMMEDWKDGNYRADWSGPPGVPGDVTPEGMDKAALEKCVGAAFWLGIEVGGDKGERVILREDNYDAPFRLKHAKLEPGEVTRYLALPWQADFQCCTESEESYWWPVPRPLDVETQGGQRKAWDRGIPKEPSTGEKNMVEDWSRLGFVVEQQGQQVEVGNCLDQAASIRLLTPSIDFGQVPHGPMGSRTTKRAIVFEVDPPVCPDSNAEGPDPKVVLEVTSGPRGGNNIGVRRIPRKVECSDDPGALETVRFPVTYETEYDGQGGGDLSTTTVTVEEKDGAGRWEIDVRAETRKAEETAVSLVLDRSGSMDERLADGTRKIESLKEAARTFVTTMAAGHGVSLVAYNDTATSLPPDEESAARRIGEDDHRRETLDRIDTSGELTPDGTTSIGAGIAEGRRTLEPVRGTYDEEALLVFTDGKENTPPMIADVADRVDERTFSVGLGKPANTSAPALQNLAGNHGGYLLITDEIDRESRFVLQKYFLQILSGINNAEVVLDPEGTLRGDRVHRVPFDVTDVDNGLDVILLASEPRAVDFRLETPAGRILEPWRAQADPAMRWVLSDEVTYYRISLPVEVVEDRTEDYGRWHALLSLGEPRTEPDPDEVERLDALVGERDDETRSAPRLTAEGPGDVRRFDDEPARPATSEARERGLRYSLLVHSYSDLRMDASIEQSGFEPGEELHLRASVKEAETTVEEARVWAEITRPDGANERVPLEAGDGGFRATVATTAPGTYQVRLRARGRTSRGVPFQREQRLTGAVWHGGDRDAERGSRPGPRGGASLDRLGGIVDCLFGEDGVMDESLRCRLEDAGVDLEAVRRCVRGYLRGLDPSRHEDAGSGAARTARELLAEQVAEEPEAGE